MLRQAVSKHTKAYSASVTSTRSIVSSATAVWKGQLKSGTGNLTTPSKSLTAQYTFGSRFEHGAKHNGEKNYLTLLTMHFI
jgi:hypothetical protein